MSDIKNIWQRGIAAISQLWTKHEPEKEKETAAPEEEKTLYHPMGYDIDELKKVAPFQIKDTEKIMQELLTRLDVWRVAFQQFGHRNGVIGNKGEDEATKLAESYSTYLRVEVETEILGVMDALDREVDFKKEQKQSEDKNYHDEKEYLDYLNIQYRYNSNSFSLTLAIIYLIIGTALFISDIPLALELIKSGFSLLTSKEFPISDLFFDFKNVFINNWEAFFTAFGVAFITIYIKMYYDDYVGFSEGANSIRKKKLATLVAGNEQLVEREQKRKFWVRTVILALVLAMLIFLAIFRSLSAKKLDPNFNDGTISQAVFFFITLMLPIVSGICISISLKTFQNRRSKSKAIKVVDVAKAKLDNAARELNDTEKKKNVVTSLYTNWIKEDKFYDFIKGFLLSFYKYGFELGLLEPEFYDKETDYMRRVEIMRNKTLARNTFERLKELKNKTS